MDQRGDGGGAAAGVVKAHRRQPRYPRRQGVGLHAGDLLYKCWFSREGTPDMQVIAVRREDAHLDIIVSWFRGGRPVMRGRCGKEHPFGDKELYGYVEELQRTLDEAQSGVVLDFIDFEPYSTAEEQERVLRAMGYYLDRVGDGKAH